MNNIKRGIFKAVGDVLTALDIAYNISENFYNKKKVIEFEDKIKDEIENVTGIHIEREEERIKRLSKFIDINLESKESKAIRKYYEENIDKIKENEELEKDKERIANIKAIFGVSLICTSIIGFVILIMYYM